MKFITTDPTLFTRQVAAAKKSMKATLQDAMAREIRKIFDKTRLDITSKACIEIAQELNLTQLAEEMESDLRVEGIIGGLDNV